MRKAIIIFTIIFFVMNISAQENQLWHGGKCAVVLTYDDGLNVHLDNAIPLLDSFDIKGTFYIPGNSQPFSERINEWRIAAKNGHELGNHTLFHPCDGSLQGREWVPEDHDLSNYNLKQVVDEIRIANTLLEAVDGKDKRTFAYTCGDREVDGQLFYNQLKNDFVAARGVFSDMNHPDNLDLDNINSYAINGESGDDLIALVKKAEESGSLLVFLFHGVGGEHSMNVSLLAHKELIEYLNENRKNIWIGTLVDAASQFIQFQNS